MTYSREDFIAATGRTPELDDLERCNCALAGSPGHFSCGVCTEHNLPLFECGPCFIQAYKKEEGIHKPHKE